MIRLALLAIFVFVLGVPAPVLAAVALDPTTMIALVAAFFGPLITYLVAARRFSGKIETTEAKSLWEESRSIRHDLAGRLQEVNGVVDRLEARVAELEAENKELRRRLDGMVGP